MRPVNPVELRKILASIRIGPERYKQEYLIPIAVKRVTVDMSTITSTPGDGGDVYKILKFIGDGRPQVWGCGGQHRTKALEKWYKELKEQVTKMQGQYMKMVDEPDKVRLEDVNLLGQSSRKRRGS
jgi:hypothetical protein